MLQALLISNLILWILVLLLAAALLALARQIGVLHERIAPAGALVPRETPRVGDAAPRFELPSWDNSLLRIGAPRDDGRSTLLVFVAPGCPVCKTILPIVHSIQRAEHAWLQVVLAGDGSRDEHVAFVETHRLAPSAYVLSSELGLAYQVPKLPYAVLIDAGGLVRAKGLVNTREHIESLFEAMRHGVASIQEFARREKASREVA